MLEALRLALASASEAADWVDQSQASLAPEQLGSPSMADLKCAPLPSHAVGAHAAEMTDAGDIVMGGEAMELDAERPVAEGGHPGQESADIVGHTASSPKGFFDIERLPVHDNTEKAPGPAERSVPRGNAWRGFAGRLRTAARGRLPDLQPLLALLASLHAEIHSQDKPPPMEVRDSV